MREKKERRKIHSFTLTDEVFAYLKQKAAEEERTVSSMVERCILELKKIKESQA
jgi:predicted branched-subunit amino acid permease